MTLIMNKITKISAMALLAASTVFTGCIKETEPTTVVTAESVAQSATAVNALVNAIAVRQALSRFFPDRESSGLLLKKDMLYSG